MSFELELFYFTFPCPKNNIHNIIILDVLYMGMKFDLSLQENNIYCAEENTEI
jgi:hypothetical protein